jgi:hypothetical protein
MLLIMAIRCGRSSATECQGLLGSVISLFSDSTAASRAQTAPSVILRRSSLSATETAKSLLNFTAPRHGAACDWLRATVFVVRVLVL